MAGVRSVQWYYSLLPPLDYHQFLQPASRTIISSKHVLSPRDRYHSLLFGCDCLDPKVNALIGSLFILLGLAFSCVFGWNEGYAMQNHTLKAWCIFAPLWIDCP
ncbi:hypothetical protein Droror1_Dr00013698 [Drosera rotundifolia]